MIRTALLVGASVIAAACVACTPKQPPPTPVAHRAQRCTDEDSFIKSVRIVQPGYYPNKEYAEPPVTDDPLPPVVETDLRSAFRIAPRSFQQAVCALDGVYVTQADCDSGGPNKKTCFDSSWGFRSPYDPNKGKRYIAISLSNWTVGQPLRKADSRSGANKTGYRNAQRLTEYSTSQLNTLLKTLNDLPWKAPPKFDSKFGRDDPANTPGMTVLAVLAHELGHVRWYDWVEPVPGNPHEHASNYNLTLLMKCVPNGFFRDSWNPYVAPPNEPFVAPDWLTFGLQADAGLINHATDPMISDFVKPGQRVPDGDQPRAQNYQPRRGRGQLDALAQSLDDVYNDEHPWPSLLGSLSPTEDLVETYVLSVLTQASTPLRSLRLNITRPNGQVVHEDVVAHLSDKSTLARKLACVSTLSQTNP